MAGRWFASMAVVLVAGLGAGIVVRAEPATVQSTRPASGPARPDDAQIRSMVRQLNHPVHARRRAAIRQLAEWGPVAFPELRRVARSGSMEAALSARDLLGELESAVLIGTQMRLEVDRPRVAWNEPFTLTVHAVNPTEEKIEVPWPAERTPASQPAVGGEGKQTPGTQPHEAGGDPRPLGDEPRQVAAVMDAGDFLVVTGPDGQALDVRVEPIERHPDVYNAVNLRARDKSPSHPVPAGASDRLVIPSFNRGWARYPMLKAGRYTISFCYQPQWNDPSWTKEGFGLVRSEPVVVDVTEAAPELIRTADVALRLHVRRDGDSLLAEMESTWDHELWINLNIGDNLQTHARVEWHLRDKDGGEAKPGDQEKEPIRWDPDSTGEAFSLERVHVLKPGERLVIGRVPLATLREEWAKAARPPAQVEVLAKYLNLGNAPQIREATAERGRAVEPPTHLFSGTVVSEPVGLVR